MNETIYFSAEEVVFPDPQQQQFGSGFSSLDEGTPSAYHTPTKLANGGIRNGPGGGNSALLLLDALNALPSQESLDLYHDAYSTLHIPKTSAAFPLLLPNWESPPPRQLLQQHCQRRRHFSSGAAYEETSGDKAIVRRGLTTSAANEGQPQVELGESQDARDWEDADERTSMLPRCPLTKEQRLSSQFRSQISRSCNGSPFHVPRLSLSTNSLKRKSADSMSRSGSPQKQFAKGNSITTFIPCEDVDMIKESDEAESKIDCNEGLCEPSPVLPNGDITLHASKVLDAANESEETSSPEWIRDSHQPHSVAVKTSSSSYLPWKANYVPCLELRTFCNSTTPIGLKCEEEPQFTEAKKFCPSKTIRRKRRLWQSIKEEFTLKNFKLNHKNPHLFVTSQWQQPNQMCCMYLAYRLFWGVYFTMWGIWSIVGFADYDPRLYVKAHYLAYLTSWGIWWLAVDTMHQAVLVARHMKKISEDGDARYAKMSGAFKTSWHLSNVTCTLHIFITLLYWTSVYPYRSRPVNSVGVNTHIIPCIYVIIDLFISATPRRVYHAYLPMGLLTTYGIFSDVFYLAGGTNVEGNPALYPLLDWSEQFKTLLIGSGLVLIVIPLIHIMIVCVLYGFRVKLWRNLNYPRHDRDIETQFVSMEEKV